MLGESMEKIYTLKFSRGQFLRTVRSFILRKLGLAYFIALILLLAYFVFKLHSGDRSWVVGILGSIVCFGIIIPIAAMVGHIRIGLRKLAEMPDATATMTITDNGLVVRSGSGSSDIPWKAITEVWQYPQYWLLLSGGHYLMTIPLTAINDGERNTIRELFKKANVKIA
jgi:uncharacterized membrane protein (DUF485 family)